MLYKSFLFLFLSFIFLFIFSPISLAKSDLNFKETFVKGSIVEILDQGVKSINNIKVYSEKFKVRISEGSEKGKAVVIERILDPKSLQLTDQKISKGEEIVVKKQESSDTTQYFFYESYRLNTLLFVSIFFLFFIFFVAGKRGIQAIAGLIITILVIGFYIIPQIINGQNPLTVSLIGSFVILVVSTYVAHGISFKTTIAVVATAISLLFAAVIANYFVNILHLFGLGSEEVYSLQMGMPNGIDPKGLLLGAILIGTLGALDDITTTQTITMFTLISDNPKQKFLDLFDKGMIIGKEHIAALINTLVLAYAGSSLAVFIYFGLNPSNLPWWVILNNETTIEEVVRSLAGSTALILAVPLTTILACVASLKKFNKKVKIG